MAFKKTSIGVPDPFPTTESANPETHLPFGEIINDLINETSLNSFLFLEAENTFRAITLRNMSTSGHRKKNGNNPKKDSECE